ncbi:MAG TPA: protein kinase [Polyangiaceae bacterium]|nr:protein kinase [Polyangiaceae bacterium]
MSTQRLPFAMIGEHYRLEAPIGEGGFGAVYRAVDLRIDRPVAVKLLHRELMGSGDVEARFLREAELARRLQHPNTVRLVDFGRAHDGTPFLVFEFLAGESLDALLGRVGGLSPARVAHIGAQVLKSLMEAHALGIVHRDIKPANLFLTRHAGEPDFVKVLDFGVAKAPQGQMTALTATGLTLGTPSYMAPELLRGEPVSAASDVYALGLVLAEALTGSVIIWGATPALTMMEQLADRAVSLPPQVMESPLGPLIQRATQKVVEHRYASAEEMLAELERLANPSSTERAPSPVAQVATAPAPFRAPPYAPWPGPPVAMMNVAPRSSAVGIGAAVGVGVFALLALVAGVFVWALWRPTAAATDDVPREEPRRVEPSAAASESVSGAPDPTAALFVTLSDHSPRKGPKPAKVTVVVFSDFQCPFCKRLVPTLQEIEKSYPEDVAIVFMHQPLPMHQRAMEAALALQAAHRQGKAWEMHDKMFENEKVLSREDLERYAREIGLDVARFKRDMDDPKVKQEVLDDQKIANQVGANGTPTLFINGRKLPGARPFSDFKPIIDDELAHADELIKGGTPLADVYEKRSRRALASGR